MERENRRFELSRVSGAPVTDEELLADLKRIAETSGSSTVGQKTYRKCGTYDDSTVTRRFGSWNAGLRAAGLSVSYERSISDDRLFENLLALWQSTTGGNHGGPNSRAPHQPYLKVPTAADSDHGLRPCKRLSNTPTQPILTRWSCRSERPRRIAE